MQFLSSFLSRRLTIIYDTSCNAVLFISTIGSRQSKRARKEIVEENMGSESLYPSRQVGMAHSTLTSVASKTELEKHVAILLNIKKEHPEHEAVSSGCLAVFVMSEPHAVKY